MAPLTPIIAYWHCICYFQEAEYKKKVLAGIKPSGGVESKKPGTYIITSWIIS